MSLKREASSRSTLVAPLDDDESSTGSIYTTCDHLSDPEVGDRRRSRRQLFASSRELSSSSLSLSQRSLRTMARIHQLLESPNSEGSESDKQKWVADRAASDYEDHGIYLHDVSDNASESSILDYIITATEAGKRLDLDYEDTETDETDWTGRKNVDGRGMDLAHVNRRSSRCQPSCRGLARACRVVPLVMFAAVGIYLLVWEILPLSRQRSEAQGTASELHPPYDNTPVASLPTVNATSSDDYHPLPKRPFPSPMSDESESAPATEAPTPESEGLNSSQPGEESTSSSQASNTVPPSPCVDVDDKDWVDVVGGVTNVRNCAWLRNQSILERAAWCSDGASQAFSTCKLTCGTC